MRIAILTSSLIFLIIFITYLLFPESDFANFITYNWIKYSQNNAPIIGIFTSIGAIFTVLVFHTTSKATKNAEKSTNLSIKSLSLVQENNKKDNFLKQFYLLLELHNSTHKEIIENIGKYKNLISWKKVDIEDKTIQENLICWSDNISIASEKLFKNYNFTPYMITLYRLLKHIDNYFYYNTGNNKKEKKIYSSIVRGIIRNDVLYLIALNSLHSDSVFFGYRRKLKKFNFFEHLIVDNISGSIKFSTEEYIKNIEIKPAINHRINSTLKASYLFNTLNQGESTLNIKSTFPLSIIYYYRQKKDFTLLLTIIKETIKKINELINGIDNAYIEQIIPNDTLQYGSIDKIKIYMYNQDVNGVITKGNLIDNNIIYNELESINYNEGLFTSLINHKNKANSQEIVFYSKYELDIGCKNTRIPSEDMAEIYKLSIAKCRKNYIDNIQYNNLKIKIADSILSELKNNSFIQKSLNCDNFIRSKYNIVMLSEKPHDVLRKFMQKSLKNA